ncbi:UNVERIFIED_CONTAM: hypothetical protein Slati_2229800 [Sesamum latifolium]|uniref:Uncharacterized protein n=1 Tax=Sesamum latifolium TaxID=2727402 RepID=A0AAW2WUW7_9LAMI
MGKSNPCRSSPTGYNRGTFIGRLVGFLQRVGFPDISSTFHAGDYGSHHNSE